MEPGKYSNREIQLMEEKSKEEKLISTEEPEEKEIVLNEIKVSLKESNENSSFKDENKNSSILLNKISSQPRKEILRLGEEKTSSRFNYKNNITQKDLNEKKNFIPIKEFLMTEQLDLKKYQNENSRNLIDLKKLEKFKKSKIKKNGVEFDKYFEVKNLLDGFLILNHGCTDYPEEVYTVDLTGLDLESVIEEDLELFTKLHSFKAGDNKLNFEKLGAFPNLRTLILPLNNIDYLDFYVSLKFPLLEHLDLSYNKLYVTSISVLASLPNLITLDLTANNLKYLPDDISDMREWWKNATENEQLPLDDNSNGKHERSLSLALSDQGCQNRVFHHSRRASLSSNCNYQRLQINNNFPLPGFLRLEYLCLEDNFFIGDEVFKNFDDEIDEKKGTTIEEEQSSEENSTINKSAEKIPSQKKSESKNSFGMESIDKYGDNSILNTCGSFSEFNNDIYEQRKESQKKMHRYQGFPRLEELRLANNLIATLEDLMGLVALPSLQRVYLEGNTVMDPRKRIGLQKDYNIVHDLSLSYGIEVCDGIYQKEKLGSIDENYYKLVQTNINFNKILDPVSENKSLKQIKIIKKKDLKKNFIGHMLTKNKAGTILHSLFKKGVKLFPHNVQNFETLKDQKSKNLINGGRNTRRKYKYTDDDIAKMIQIGRIFTLKELNSLTEEEDCNIQKNPTAEQQKDSDLLNNDNICDTTEVSQSEMHIDNQNNEIECEVQAIDENEAQNFSKEYDVMYDSKQVDETFITGVHITGGNEGAKPLEEPNNDFSDDSEDDLEEEEETYDTSDLPVTIQASLKALRHALNNPVSYERVKEASYVQPTFAYKRKLRDVQSRYSLPESLRKPDNFSHKIPLPPQTLPPIPPKLHNVRDVIPSNYFRPNSKFNKNPNFNNISNNCSSGTYKNRTLDEFEDMKNLLSNVDEKLDIIETKLDNILGNEKLKKYLPQGAILLNEVKISYEKIQKNYMREALEVMQLEASNKAGEALKNAIDKYGYKKNITEIPST
ncbi:X-ray radiation resistance-associated protein 1 [Lobulomyces angularis]|nr:X-ray radiation resistance-associated protein 1 [Lobulomyces angularis]